MAFDQVLAVVLEFHDWTFDCSLIGLLMLGKLPHYLMPGSIAPLERNQVILTSEQLVLWSRSGSSKCFE